MYWQFQSTEKRTTTKNIAYRAFQPTNNIPVILKRRLCIQGFWGVEFSDHEHEGLSGLCYLLNIIQLIHQFKFQAVTKIKTFQVLTNFYFKVWQVENKMSNDLKHPWNHLKQNETSNKLTHKARHSTPYCYYSLGKNDSPQQIWTSLRISRSKVKRKI